jgi:phage terminase small subunit
MTGTQVRREVDASQPLRADMRERFCREYIIDLDGTQAAIRAGYSAKTASVQASKDLLRNPHVRARIAFLQAKTVNGLEINAINVVRELAKLGLANMDDYMTVQTDGSAVLDLGDTSRDQRAAIQELVVDEYTDGKGDAARDVKRTRIKLHDKRGALVDLGRHLGIFEADNQQGPGVIIEIRRTG